MFRILRSFSSFFFTTVSPSLYGQSTTIVGPSSDIPTLREIYPNADIQNWFGMFAPVGTPKPLLERIATDATRVVNEPAFRDKYVTAAGLEVMNAGPDAFAEMVRADRASYAQRVKALGNVKID